MHRAEAADDDHQQQVDRLQDVELVGRDELQLVRIERAADAGERRRDRERQRLVAREMDAHALRRDLGVADRDEGAAGRRAQQVEDRERRAERDDEIDAKGSTNLSPIPKAEKAGKLKVVENARATEIVVGADGRVTGVKYIKGKAEHFQPAKAVLVAGYTYENVRLLLLSKSSAFPNGLSNNHGQVGRHFLAHTRAGANGVIPGRRLNRYSGSAGQWTALDDWDSDFFDHTGLGFIGGGTMSATMEAKPIAAARTTPPSLPRWGSAWKAWLKQNAIAVASTSTQINTTPYESNFIDLDPTTKDPHGIPVARVTQELKPMERAAAQFVGEKCLEWLLAAGASETWLVAPSAAAIQTHAFGGTRMGDDPDENVTDQWCLSHEVPNLGILGASNFPTSGGRNPTETVMALAWRTADQLVSSWSDRTG